MSVEPVWFVLGHERGTSRIYVLGGSKKETATEVIEESKSKIENSDTWDFTAINMVGGIDDVTSNLYKFFARVGVPDDEWEEISIKFVLEVKKLVVPDKSARKPHGKQTPELN